MQQRPQIGRPVEVALRQGEPPVGQHQNLSDRVACEQDIGLGHQQEIPRGERGPCHNQRHRPDALDPAFPEPCERERPRFKVLDDQARDEKARDHKERVHADVPAAEPEPSVEQDDRKHADRAQTVDISSVLQSRHGPLSLLLYLRSQDRPMASAKCHKTMLPNKLHNNIAPEHLNESTPLHRRAPCATRRSPYTAAVGLRPRIFGRRSYYSARRSRSCWRDTRPRPRCPCSRGARSGRGPGRTRGPGDPGSPSAG